MISTLECSKSTHRSEVVPIKLEPHYNADKLSVIPVFGYTVVGNTESWLGVDKAIYVTPDSLVDTKRPEFAFLASEADSDGLYRVKAKKLRGIVSYGLLVPAPADATIGDDYSQQLGVTRYEPEERGDAGQKKQKMLLGGEDEAAPDCDTGPEKYDVDSFERYAFLVLEEGEPVQISEKLDGCLHETSLVRMSDNTQKRISQVKPGEQVKSFSPEKQLFEDNTVLNVFVKPADKQWITLIFDTGRELICTTDHLIMTNRGWVEAINLQFTDEIVSYEV